MKTVRSEATEGYPLAGFSSSSRHTPGRGLRPPRNGRVHEADEGDGLLGFPAVERDEQPEFPVCFARRELGRSRDPHQRVVAEEPARAGPSALEDMAQVQACTARARADMHGKARGAQENHVAKRA